MWFPSSLFALSTDFPFSLTISFLCCPQFPSSGRDHYSQRGKESSSRITLDPLQTGRQTGWIAPSLSFAESLANSQLCKRMRMGGIFSRIDRIWLDLSLLLFLCLLPFLSSLQRFLSHISNCCERIPVLCVSLREAFHLAEESSSSREEESERPLSKFFPLTTWLRNSLPVIVIVSTFCQPVFSHSLSHLPSLYETSLSSSLF